MTSTPLSKIITTCLIVCAIIAGFGLAFGSPQINIQSISKWMDIWRSFIAIQAGLFIGLNLSCAVSVSKIKVDPEDKFLRPLGAILASACILAIYTGVTILGKLGDQFLSWRTPVAFISFTIGDISLVVLFRRIHMAMQILKGKQATIKLTFINSSSPEVIAHPEIDLSKH